MFGCDVINREEKKIEGGGIEVKFWERLGALESALECVQHSFPPITLILAHFSL